LNRLWSFQEHGGKIAGPRPDFKTSLRVGPSREFVNCLTWPTDFGFTWFYQVRSLANWFYLVLPEVWHLADVGVRGWSGWDRRTNEWSAALPVINVVKLSFLVLPGFTRGGRWLICNDLEQAWFKH
jgi:hypothetical protein